MGIFWILLGWVVVGFLTLLTMFVFWSKKEGKTVTSEFDFDDYIDFADSYIHWKYDDHIEDMNLFEVIWLASIDMILWPRRLYVIKTELIPELMDVYGSMF